MMDSDRLGKDVGFDLDKISTYLFAPNTHLSFVMRTLLRYEAASHILDTEAGCDVFLARQRGASIATYEL